MHLRLLPLCFLLSFTLSAQTLPEAATTPAATPPPFQPQVSAYIGIVHPIVTFQGKNTIWNFDEYYLSGLTTAVIVRKAPKFAYSLELVGFMRAQNGSSRASNLMLHPGVTFYLKNNFAITPRIGFETSGRYGFTFVFTKTMLKTKYNVFNFNLVNLYRYGAEAKPSVTFAINLTCGF